MLLWCSTVSLPKTLSNEIVEQREACAPQLLPDGSGQVSSEPNCWLERSWQRQPCGHSLSWPSFAMVVQVSCPTRARLSPALRTPLWIAASCVRSPGPAQVFLATVSQASAVRLNTDVRQEQGQNIPALCSLLWALPVPTANLKLSWLPL